MRDLWTRIATLAVGVALAAPASAARVCGWLDEHRDKDRLHTFDLYLQADGEAELYYMMKGEGVTTESSRTYSPSKGTYVLHAGRTAKVWGFGTNVNPGANIDIVAEIHAWPASVFDEEEPPLLGAFTFRRHVPDDQAEDAPIPKDFATKQCATVPPPKPR